MLNLFDGIFHFLLGGDENICRIDIYHVQLFDASAAFGIKRLNRFDFIVPENNFYRMICIRGENIHCIAPDSEISARKLCFCSAVQAFHKTPEQFMAVDPIAFF